MEEKFCKKGKSGQSAGSGDLRSKKWKRKIALLKKICYSFSMN